MTYQSYPPQPARPKKKIGTGATIGITVAAVILGCCGIGSVGALLDGGNGTKTVALPASPPAVSRSTVPTPTEDVADAGVSPEPTVTAVPSPVVSASPTRTPAADRTTSRPTVRPTAKPTKKPVAKPTTSKPKPRPTKAASVVNVVHPGAFCKVAGARGVTKTGKPMVCKRTASDPKLRWRAA